MSEPRTREQRIADTRIRLEQDVDLWVSSASIEGEPYLIPLSFDWDGEQIVLATLAESATGRNLAVSGRVRLGAGSTRDVIVIEGSVRVFDLADLEGTRADRFADRTGFDPRAERERYRWFVVTPRLIQAWRESNELKGRTLMRDGAWLI